MPNKFHRDLTDSSIHAVNARTYADIAARDADTAFQIAANINKMVRVDSPANMYTLISIGPTVWLDVGGLDSDTLAEILANGNTTGGTNIEISAGDTITTPTDTDLVLDPNGTGDLDVSTSKITNVVDPTGAQDAATKAYADTGDAIVDTLAQVLAAGNVSGGSDVLIDGTDLLEVNTAATFGGLAVPGVHLSIDAIGSKASGLPSMDSTTRDGLVGIRAGAQIWNTTSGQMENFDGVLWNGMAGSGLFHQVYPSSDKLVLALSGQDQLDRSAHGNEVVFEGSAIIAEGGLFGKTLRLDDSAGTFVTIPDRPLLTFTDAITAAAWVFPNTDGSGFDPLITKMNTSSLNGWNFTYQSNRPRVIFRDAGVEHGTGGIYGPANIIPTGVWTHVAWTFLASTNELITYINGAVIDTRTLTGGWADSGTDLRIGARDTSNFYDGDLNNVEVYNRILTGEEIQTHYQRASLYQNQSALVSDRLRITDTVVPLRATGILTLTGQPLDTETVTIDTKIYTFQTVLTNVNGNVLIGASASDSIDNLVNAIILGPGAGSEYAALTILHPTAMAAAGAGDTMDTSARLAGTLGNSIATTETLTNGSWAAVTLLGGIDAFTWADLNSTARLPAVSGPNTFYISAADKLPVPEADFIDLEPGDYVLIGDVDIGASKLRFDHVGETLTIHSLNGRQNVITSSTTDTFLNIVNALDLHLDDIDVLLTGAGAEFIDNAGMASTAFSNQLRVTFTGGGATSIGRMRSGLGMNFNLPAFVNYRNGMVFDGISSAQMENFFFISDFAGSGPALDVKTLSVASTFKSGGIIGGAGESLFNIDPDFTEGANGVFIDNVIKLGGQTNYFEAGTTGLMTTPFYADAAIASTGIDSVTDSGGVARFNFTVGPTVYVHQKVTISGFITNTAYNVTGILTAVGAGFFEIASVAFGSDEAVGSFVSASVTVTDTGHGLSEAQTLLITESVDYNGGDTIYNVTTDTFDINAVFTIAHPSGMWNTGSLTQRDRRVEVKSSGAQASSMNIAFAQVFGNEILTTLAASSTYEAVDFSVLSLDPSSELWILVDPVAGIFRYEGLNPVVGSLVASLTAFKTGSTQIYRFTTSKNGAIPSFPNSPRIPLELATTQVNGTLVLPVSVDPFDEIQIMGGGDGTSDSYTVGNALIQMIF